MTKIIIKCTLVKNTRKPFKIATKHAQMSWIFANPTKYKSKFIEDWYPSFIMFPIEL